ncbi:MAG TPA: hypothetical protein VM901_06795 [Bdellovibrionota bacterium]|jgi:hypothetical protein|nr:hypothetical protein [Bdellovibrionota bacterium]
MFSKRIWLVSILSLISATSAFGYELKKKIDLNFISSNTELSDAAYGKARVTERLTDSAKALHMWYEVNSKGKLDFYILTDRGDQQGSATQPEMTNGKIFIDGENLTALSVLARFGYVENITFGLVNGTEGKSLTLRNVRLTNGTDLTSASLAEMQTKGMVRTEPRVEVLESFVRLILSKDEIKALGLEQSLLELDKAKVGTRQEKYIDFEQLTIDLDILRAGAIKK